jgi:hypothetical protein
VAALTRTDVVETEQPFDLDWADKRKQERSATTA